MRKILLLSAMLIASVFTAKAQLELSGSVTTNPRTDWTPDEYAYDMSQVATYLGYEDVAEFDAALWAFVKGESTEIDMWNISKNGNEVNTQRDNSATCWIWDPVAGDWYNNYRGCFWLDLDGEESGWYAPAAFWTQVTWDAENNALYHGIGQNGYKQTEPGQFLARTKITRGTTYVVLNTLLIIEKPAELPFEQISLLDQLTIVADAKVEVTQPIMLDWGENPAWSVNAGELITAVEEFDLALINSNMNDVFWCRGWDTAADDFSNQLSNLHEANGYGFWMKHTVDTETGLDTEYCVPDNWTGAQDFFTENIVFHPEDSTITGAAGQNPNRRFKGGEHFYTDYYVVLGDKALHIEFHFNVEKDVEYAIEDMTKVGERTITWVQEPRTNTAGLKKWIPNYAEILELLGCNEAGVRFKLLQPDNTMESVTNTGNNGFWIDEAGYKTTPAEDKLAFYVDYTDDLMALSVGQYPSVAVPGDELTATIILCNKEKYYQINVILAIEDLTKADPADYHEVAKYTYSLRSLIDGTWNVTEHQTEPLDMDVVEEQLGTSDFVVYAKVGDTWTTGYTCTPYPGFWFTIDNQVAGWGDSYTGFCYERNYVLAFKNPQQNENITAGDSYTNSMYLVNEVTGAYVTLTMQVTYVDEIVDYVTVGEDQFTIDVNPYVDGGYATVEYDATAMFEALGVTAEDLWNGDVKVMAKNGDLYEEVNEPGFYEYFFDAEGNVVPADGSIYSFQTVFEQGEGNNINATGCITDLDPDDLSGQERSTTFCIQKKTKRFFLTVRLFYGEFDSIEGIVANAKQKSIFNLQGQRVNAPVRGLYIIDGRKVFVK